MASRITSCEIHDINLGASLRFYWNGHVLNIYMYFSFHICLKTFCSCRTCNFGVYLVDVDNKKLGFILP